jgi:hypothetical protein
MIDIVVDFSKREGYLLQPTKSVVLQVKSKCKSMEINDGFWKLKYCNMPIVTQASHIGIQKLAVSGSRPFSPCKPVPIRL